MGGILSGQQSRPFESPKQASLAPKALERQAEIDAAGNGLNWPPPPNCRRSSRLQARAQAQASYAAELRAQMAAKEQRRQQERQQSLRQSVAFLDLRTAAASGMLPTAGAAARAGGARGPLPAAQPVTGTAPLPLRHDSSHAMATHRQPQPWMGWQEAAPPPPAMEAPPVPDPWGPAAPAGRAWDQALPGSAEAWHGAAQPAAHFSSPPPHRVVFEVPPAGYPHPAWQPPLSGSLSPGPSHRAPPAGGRQPPYGVEPEVGGSPPSLPPRFHPAAAVRAPFGNDLQPPSPLLARASSRRHVALPGVQAQRSGELVPPWGPPPEAGSPARGGGQPGGGGSPFKAAGALAEIGAELQGLAARAAQERKRAEYRAELAAQVALKGERQRQVRGARAPVGEAPRGGGRQIGAA